MPRLIRFCFQLAPKPRPCQARSTTSLLGTGGSRAEHSRPFAVPLHDGQEGRELVERARLVVLADGPPSHLLITQAKQATSRAAPLLKSCPIKRKLVVETEHD